jgi:hypothetical protein
MLVAHWMQRRIGHGSRGGARRLLADALEAGKKSRTPRASAAPTCPDQVATTIGEARPILHVSGCMNRRGIAIDHAIILSRRMRHEKIQDPLYPCRYRTCGFAARRRSVGLGTRSILASKACYFGEPTHQLATIAAHVGDLVGIYRAIRGMPSMSRQDLGPPHTAVRQEPQVRACRPISSLATVTIRRLTLVLPSSRQGRRRCFWPVNPRQHAIKTIRFSQGWSGHAHAANGRQHRCGRPKRDVSP